VTDSQRRELTQSMNRSHGSFELVVSPLLFALIGYGLDRWIGTTPWITVIFAIIGLAGAVVKIYYSYEVEMRQHEAEGPWAKRS
jgi:F0F1-type ATP synthase assembly protein I